ncbi:mucin-5AC isoform X2 [Athalia rosae]|uniref:mucin-5AC isoform X2 n=1 Tax=Athalia rosae TaxID=37344 RepID=UPI0020342835|nr:mucin-5AC isoform X2 [Athalia rosae]
MDSNMSTAFAHRGSSGSASTSSSGTGTGTGSGGRVAVVGVTRSVRLRKRGSSGFGFSLRGGREHAAGFFVSEVQPGGEAQRNGLRVGDQIIRVNGYPVEDAVHQEVALLARTQQVLVLKIRSVGMIPVKDNPNDPVTWHMVQQQCENGSSILPLSTEIRVRVLVGSKGRLGCGVCRGPSPGLTVQNTREGGPARAAGLRPGDVIVKCNGHRLTELPFEKAVEVMRSSGVLDLVVNRPTYYTPDPGDTIFRGSSGYDSGNSSLLESSPLPAPPPPQQGPVPGRHVYPQNQALCNARNPQRPRTTGSREVQWADIDGKGERTCCPLASSTDSCSSSGSWRHMDQMVEWTRKPNNTTVIHVNQRPGDPAPYLGRGSHSGYRPGEDEDEEPLYDPVAVSRGGYESHYFEADGDIETGRQDLTDNGGICSPLYDPVANGYRDPKDDLREGGRLAEMQFIQKQKETETKTITTVEVHHAICPPPPPCMPPPGSCKWPASQYFDSKPPMSAVGVQMGSTMSMGSTGSTETESSLESSCGKDSVSTSSSSSTCEPASSSSSYVSVATRKILDDQEHSNVIPPAPVAPPLPAVAANIDLSSAIAQELQRRAQKARASQDKSTAQEARNQRIAEPTKTSPAHEQKITHDKLMEEFKRAYQRMFNCKRNGDPNAPADSPVIPANGTVPPAETPEQERPTRASNGIVQRRQTSGAPTPPPPPPRGVTAARTKTNTASDDAVEMQSIESFKLKEPQSVPPPKPPSTYFPSIPREEPAPGRTGSPIGSAGGNAKKPLPVQVPTVPLIPNGTNAGASVNNAAGKGKIAIRIGAYSGEAKAPAKLDFLGNQSPTTTSTAPTTTTPASARGGDQARDSSVPVASRLQNELAATLQRSNLKKKTDEDNNVATNKTVTGNAVSPTRGIPQATENPAILTQNNVEKLAAVLSNKVTIKINTTENISRQD